MRAALEQQLRLEPHRPVAHHKLVPTPLDEFRDQDDDLPIRPRCGELTQPGQEPFEELAVR